MGFPTTITDFTRRTQNYTKQCVYSSIKDEYEFGTQGIVCFNEHMLHPGSFIQKGIFISISKNQFQENWYGTSYITYIVLAYHPKPLNLPSYTNSDSVILAHLLFHMITIISMEINILQLTITQIPHPLINQPVYVP